MKNILTVLCFAIWGTLCMIPAIPAYCRSRSPRPSGSPEAGEQPFRAATQPFWTEHGRLTLNFKISYGLENDIPRDISHINMVFAEPQIGLIAWNSPHSRLPIKRIEVLGGEILGGSFHPGGEMFGTSLLLHFGLQPMGRVVPYFDAGSGPVHTTISSHASELTGHMQFMSQGGVGLQYFFKPQHALVFEYQYFHMSNGGLQQPNPGFNGGMITIGFCWLRGLRPSATRASNGSRARFPHFW
jgi:Lipid A 3-O-deacylase (PagL)